MSEEKPNAGFFDEEEEITLSENELNNILNNSTIELEESTENLENIDSGSSSEDNLIITSGSELEEEYLAKVSQVENPLESFSLIHEGSSIQEHTTSNIPEETIQKPVIEEIKIDEQEEISINAEDDLTPNIYEVEEEKFQDKTISDSQKNEEIIIESTEISPKVEEISIDENIVIEEIQEDEILLDETENEDEIEEISLEDEEGIQEPEDTQELVIEEDTSEISLSEGTIEGKELGEIKAEPDAIIEEKPLTADDLINNEEKIEIIEIKDNVLPTEETEITIEEEVKIPEKQEIITKHDEIKIDETPTLEETGHLKTEEGIIELVIDEQKDKATLPNKEKEPVIKENIPTEFFKEEKPDLQEAELSAHVDEILIEEPAVQTETTAPIKKDEMKAEDKTALSNMIKDAANIAPENVKNVLLYLDSLFAYLPEDKIREFAKSKYYDMYNKIFDDLGL